jgi:hypothetical protein
LMPCSASCPGLRCGPRRFGCCSSAGCNFSTQANRLAGPHRRDMILRQTTAVQRGRVLGNSHSNRCQASAPSLFVVAGIPLGTVQPDVLPT